MTPHDTLSRMEELEGHLSLLTLQILSASAPESLHNLFAGAAQNATNQSRRIREAYERDPRGEIDAIAWSVRCLMELRLLLHYNFQKEEQEAMDTIRDELTRDDCEIAFGFYYSLDDEPAKDQLQSSIRTLPKTPDNAQLAGRSGFTSEYKTYCKFLCKYTHPSMYLLFMNPEEVRKKAYVDLMLERGESYLTDICEALNYVVDSIE